MFADSLMLELQRAPLLMRTLVKLLPKRGPIVRFGNTVLVRGAHEAREVFARADDFQPGVLYAPKLEFGACVLGMDLSPVYDAEKNALHRIFAAQPTIARFGAFVQAECQHRTQELRAGFGSSRGRVDLVTDFIEPVLMRAAADLYGVRLADAKSRYLATAQGAETMAHWLRKLGGLLVCSVPPPFGLQALTERLGAEMQDWLREAVRRAPSDADGGWLPVIAALKSMPDRPASLQHEDAIVRCAGTLMLAGVTMVKASALSLHQLLLRPPGDRKAAVSAAERGDTAAVLAYVWEALRFAPVFPLLPRYCPRATTLASGTPHATSVPAGATVVVSPLGAMFDPRAVDHAEEFIPGRDDSVYLHFADGPHRCLARALASEALGALFTHLLANFELTAGTLVHDGPVVGSYLVNLKLKEAGPNAATPSNHPGPARHGHRGQAHPVV